MTKVELALSDFQFFIGTYCKIKLWKWQRKLADDTQAAIESDIYFNYQFLGPADHGKSSGVVIPLPLWLLARNRQHHIILVGNKDSYIQQISRACKMRISLGKDLQKDFGLLPGNKWSDEEWNIERPEVGDRIPSVLALGVGAEIQSQRADYIIGDDILSRRNSRTESQRAAINTYLDTDLHSRVDKTKRYFGKGKTLYYGHRVEANDGYKLREARVSGEERVITHKYPAIINDASEEILCPEAHSYAALADHRSRDLLGFTLMYQQESAQMGTFVTQTSMEAVRRPDLSFHNSRASIRFDDYLFTWMALDPAFSTNRWSSHAVWMLWGMTKDHKRRLLWGMRDKVSPESLLNITEIKFRLFMPDHFLMEDNQAQVLIKTYMRKKFPEHISKFKGVYTHDNDDQLQLDLQRIFDLYGIEPPAVELPFNGPSEQSFVLAMTDEYTSYPNGKRDTIMCQYIGEKGLGLIKSEERKGSVHPKGIMGSVASSYSRMSQTRPFWRR